MGIFCQRRTGSAVSGPRLMEENRMNKKKVNGRSYFSIVIVAIIAIFLSNPNWLPLPEDLKKALIQTEKSNLLFQRSLDVTIHHIPCSSNHSWPDSFMHSPMPIFIHIEYTPINCLYPPNKSSLG